MDDLIKINILGLTGAGGLFVLLINAVKTDAYISGNEVPYSLGSKLLGCIVIWSCVASLVSGAILNISAISFLANHKNRDVAASMFRQSCCVRFFGIVQILTLLAGVFVFAYMFQRLI